MFWTVQQAREVFPPEPPVAFILRPERRAAVKGAPLFGAAKRTLDREHRSGIHHTFDGRRRGNTFPLVGLERCFWIAGPVAAQEHTRRLITLIFAGRNRMVMIRRELPRTKGAGWVLRPCRIERKEGSPFRGPSAATGSAVQLYIRVCPKPSSPVSAAFRFRFQSPRQSPTVRVRSPSQSDSCSYRVPPALCNADATAVGPSRRSSSSPR